MDPISAISLAAAAAQFIELAVKVVSRLADFGANVDQAPKAFRQIRTELPLIIEGLKGIEDRSREGSQGDTGSPAAVYRVIKECQEVVKQLDGLLDKILPSPGASSWERGRKAIASLVSDAKVEELAKRLTKYIQALTFHQVVASTATQASATAETQKTGIRWLVPFDRNPSFVGRDEIFRAIDATLTVKEGVQPKAALWGLGGIGKSQVAIEHCHRIRQRDVRCSIFWVNAATISRFEESYKRIAIECGLIKRNESNGGDASFLVQTWLQTTHTDPWLMVIDNVDDKDSFFRDTLPSGNTPSQCIPKCAHGSLLSTTRTRDIAFDLATPVEPIAIPHMTKQEGIQLVKERLRRGPDPLDDTTIGELLDELECIPLAITQAISFISKRRMTIPQYLEKYRQSDVTRTRMLTFEFAEHGRQVGSLESVAKTWSVTFKWIRSNSQRAADLLCLISFFQHQAITRQLLLTPKGQAGEGLAAKKEETEEEEEEDGFYFEDALDTLCAFSLLDTGGSANIFTTHHLVQLATRWWLQNENPEEQSRWALAALQSVGRHFPAWEGIGTEYWSLCEALFPHAELVLAYNFSSKWFPNHQRTIELARAKLLVATGHYLVWMSAHDEALPRLEESVALRMRHLGERDVDTLASMGQVAWFYSLILTTPTRAIPLGQRVLALRTELLGVDHEQTIDSMCDLAGALGGNGEYIESETLIREAIERGTRTIGPRSLLVLNCTAVLAEAIENQGRFTEAVELYRLVHKWERDIYGPEDLRVLITETSLASTLVERDETWEEGESLMRRTLAIKQRTLGPDDYRTLISAWNLILALYQARRFQEARQICDASMAAWEQSTRKNNHRSAKCVEKIRHLAQTIEGEDRGSGCRQHEIEHGV